MNNPSKIIMPQTPFFFKRNQWFEAKGHAIQFLDERDHPFGRGRKVNFIVRPENASSSSDFKLKFPNVAPFSSQEVRIDDDGMVPFPDFLGNSLGIFTITISIKDVNIHKKITITDILPPRLIPQTACTTIGMGEPYATIKILSFPSNKTLVSTTADSEGIFTLRGYNNIFSSRCQIIQTLNKISSPKIEVKEVLEIPLVTNIQRSENTLKGKGRIPGTAQSPRREGAWKAYGGNYKGTFNQIFLEIGPYTESIPNDLIWNEFPKLNHTSGAVLIPLPETETGEWSIDVPPHLVSKKLYVRQALNKNSTKGHVLAFSKAQTIDEFDILEHPRSTLVSLGEDWNFYVDAQHYHSIQWQYSSIKKDKIKFVNWPNDQEGAKKKTLGRLSFPSDNECIFRAKFILPNNTVRYSNPASLTVKMPEGEDISHRFNIPNLKLLKSSPNNLLAAYPTVGDASQSLTRQDKTWFVYETTAEGYFLRMKFNEKEAASTICSRINILNIKVNDELSFKNTKDPIITRIFDSDFIRLDNEFGIIKATKGDPSSPHKLSPNTEYYITLDYVLVAHFNTNPQINKYLYGQDEKGETIERIIARINQYSWSSHLRLDITTQNEGSHDASLMIATQNNRADSGDLYGQNINGNFVVSAINPSQPLMLERKLTFYDFSKEVYCLEPGSKKTTLDIANELNALKLKSYRVSLSPFESLLQFTEKFESLPHIQTIFSYNPSFKQAYEWLKEDVDFSDTPHGVRTQNWLHATMTLFAHEAELLLKNDIHTLEQYEHHINKNGRIAPFVLYGIALGFVSMTYAIYAILTPDIEPFIYHNPDNLMPTVPVPHAPHFAVTTTPTPLGPTLITPYTDIDLVGYMNEETYVNPTTQWQEFQEGILPSLRPTLEALETEYLAELISGYESPTDEQLENLLPELRQTFERWEADLQHVQQTVVITDEDMRRTLQQAAEQLETYLMTFRSLAAWRRRLENSMYLFIRDRRTRQIVGVTRIEAAGYIFTIQYTMAHVDQITGVKKIPGLGAFIKYSVIKKIKQCSKIIAIFSYGRELSVAMNQILIGSTAVTKPSAVINKQLGFVRRRFRASLPLQ